MLPFSPKNQDRSEKYQHVEGIATAGGRTGQASPSLAKFAPDVFQRFGMEPVASSVRLSMIVARCP